MTKTALGLSCCDMMRVKVWCGSGADQSIDRVSAIVDSSRYMRSIECELPLDRSVKMSCLFLIIIRKYKRKGCYTDFPGKKILMR